MQTTTVTFNYRHFLKLKSKGRRWQVVDVLSSIAPIFSTLWHHQLDQFKDAEQMLWERALSELPRLRNDVDNLVNIVELAREYKIEQIEMILPDALKNEQIERISQLSQVKIEIMGDELLMVKL
ncbi:hypothetical protein A9264_07320 [Vibrio sp. UCD-FRSSP16_10]|uniref:hypothetical protein n=1 Tax=unclassified Vibrio TaxID=2614977 RepID=UPI000800ACBA|nr:MULTISPECIES: hypothetical protein [unclassified Vibrio]OBT13467.1 hypothetical protein A9264_07320 [Vibrio sp. UCD-FRSSP16_10]OBT17976.1 hypothetical protein A9260_01310 [Vibrio sp. UCD-FRSSP16_30]